MRAVTDDENDELWQMIRAGWGDIPQTAIPRDWRDVAGPNPWPSAMMQQAKVAKVRRDRYRRTGTPQRHQRQVSL